MESCSCARHCDGRYTFQFSTGPPFWPRCYHLSSSLCCSLTQLASVIESPYSLLAFQWVTLKPRCTQVPSAALICLWLLPDSPSTASLQGGPFNEPISGISRQAPAWHLPPLCFHHRHSAPFVVISHPHPEWRGVSSGPEERGPVGQGGGQDFAFPNRKVVPRR